MLSKLKNTRSTSRNGKRSRSRSRSRDWRSKRQQRRRSRSRSYSRSRSRDRRRSRSRSRERGRYGDRNWQRKRSSSRDRYGKRKFVRDKSGKIDKQKLYEIAQKKAKQLQQMGLMSSTGQLNDTSGKSIDQIVEYCQRLSKREEKEARREKGESVSSDSELENFAVKHPYDVRPTAPITINIANAIPIPIRSAQERIMDEAQLRLCYPVSSGAIHKDNTEWQPVDKDPIPISCTDKVKKLTAVTSLQVEEAKKMGVELPAPVPLLPPPPMPPEFDNLPPPPCPPSFVSSRSSSSSMLLPPPPLPPMIIQAPPEKLIMKEPEKEVQAPKDVAKVLAQRAAAARRLEVDPNDYDARKELKELDEQMAAWATRGNLPGKFTGSTGIRILSADELQPHDPRYNAWVKKDQFKVSRPVQSGVGMKLMQKMGWAPGEGLGKDKLGNLEPLQLDVKNDRKGLSTVEEVKPKKSKPVVVDARVAQPGLVQPTIVGNGAAVIMNDNALGNRNPVSLVMEFCAKRKWPAPTFRCFEEGGQTKCFRWEVSLNGVTYSTGSTSSTKKAAKALACQVVLQSLGLIKRDPALPMVF